MKGRDFIASKIFYKVAIYIRVSTREQVESGYSIGEQEERLKKYAEAMGWEVFKTYIDPGFSGAYLDRPALNELRNDIQRGQVDAVLVWKLDRLSRSQKDTLFLIEDVFLKNGVEFISTLENFDTSSPFGRAMIGILSVFAQLEREQIKERMQMGLDARAKEGKWHGGGFDPYGYDYIDGDLVVNEKEAAVVRKIYDLYLDQGWSINKIRRYLQERYTTKYGGFENDSTVLNILTNPIYISKLRWKNELYDAPHDPIISEERFLAVKKYRAAHPWQPKNRKQKKNPFTPGYLLSGLLYCGNCGARYYVKGAYSGHGDKKVYFPYYTCYSRGKNNPKMIVDPTCKNKSISTRDLDALLISELRKLALNPDDVEKLLKEKTAGADTFEAQKVEYEKQIKTGNEQIKRLIDLCKIGGSIPVQDIATEIEKVQHDIDKSKKALETLEIDAASASLDLDDVKEKFINAGPILDSGNYDDIRALVQSLIYKAEITKNGDLKIYWNFERQK